MDATLLSSGGGRAPSTVTVYVLPQLSHHRVTEDDLCVVMASDGVWEMLSNQEVCNPCISSTLPEHTIISRLTCAVGTQVLDIAMSHDDAAGEFLSRTCHVAHSTQPVPSSTSVCCCFYTGCADACSHLIRRATDEWAAVEGRCMLALPCLGPNDGENCRRLPR